MAHDLEDDMTATATPELDPLAGRRRAAQAKHAAALRSLMSQRDDLRGVYAVADHLDDAVRWSA
jgi:hypothetical protein